LDLNADRTMRALLGMHDRVSDVAALKSELANVADDLERIKVCGMKPLLDLGVLKQLERDEGAYAVAAAPEAEWSNLIDALELALAAAKRLGPK
jgi:hypothetical protein